MNNQVTCFLLYGSDNQQNKTIKGLTESSRTDQIFLLTDHPEDNDIPTEKCHFLPSFSFQHTALPSFFLPRQKGGYSLRYFCSSIWATGHRFS